MENKVRIKVLRSTVASGVRLKTGKTADVSERDAKLLIACGKAELSSDDSAGVDDLDQLKVAELKEIAKTCSVENYKKMNKAELIEAIRFADSDSEK